MKNEVCVLMIATAMSRKNEVLVVGPSYYETTMYLEGKLTPDTSHPVRESYSIPGGTGLNWAVGLHRMGMDVKFYSFIGLDFQGEEIKRYLEEQGIKYEMQIGQATDQATTIVDPEGVKYNFSRRKASNEFTLDENIRREIKATDWIVITTLRNKHVRELLQEASEYGKNVALATNSKNCRESHEIINIINTLKYLSLTETELGLLLGSTGLSEQELRELIYVITVTNGKRGSRLLYKDIELNVPCYNPEVPVVDTNHCGEAYGTAFLAHIIPKFGSLKMDVLIEAAGKASTAGFINATRERDSLPSLDELNQELERMREESITSLVHV